MSWMTQKALDARVALALRAVEILASSTVPLRSPDLWPGAKPEAWMRNFISQLALDGLVMKIGTATRARMYEAEDREALAALTYEEIVALLMRGEVRPTTRLSGELDEPDEPDERAAEAMPPESEPDVATLLAERLGQLTDAVIGLRDEQARLGAKVDALVANGATVLNVRDAVDKMRAAVREDTITTLISHDAAMRDGIEGLLTEHGGTRDKAIVEALREVMAARDMREGEGMADALTQLSKSILRGLDDQGNAVTRALTSQTKDIKSAIERLLEMLVHSEKFDGQDVRPSARSSPSLPIALAVMKGGHDDRHR